MRVLLLPSYFPTPDAPHRATYVLEYARSLALEHEVTVLLARERSDGAPAGGVRERWAAPGVRVVEIGYRHLRGSWMLSYLAAFGRVAGRLRREIRPDLIFAHTALPAGVAAGVLGRLLSVPVVLLEHWGPAMDWLTWSPYPPAVQRASIRFAYRSADYLGAVSRFQAADMEAVWGVPVSGVLANPVDCGVFTPAPGAPRDARVVCVTRGDPDPRKGVPVLLEAWRRVIRAGAVEARLEVVGPGTGAWGAEVRRLGIEDACTLEPWMPAHEVAGRMRAAAVVVIPSRYETFGRTGVEALACGTPVVATRCGGPEEYLDEGCGVLVPAGDPEALAEGLVAALSCGGFRPPEELAERARSGFGMEAACRRFSAVADELVGRGRGR